jgi:pimeloyl-ACP methyl ester carboxylesterase
MGARMTAGIDSTTTDHRLAFEQSEHAAAEGLGFVFRARYVDIARPKLRLRVLESGSGRSVLFVHGGGGIAAQWAPLLVRLPSLRALAVDRPGCGLSDGFDYTGVPLREHAVDVLASLLDALELPSVDIVANSMGGLWSLSLAVARPERVASLALLGCPALMLDSGAPAPLHLMSVPAIGRWMSKLMPPSLENTKKILTGVLGAPAVERMGAATLECAYRSQLVPGASESWQSLISRALTLFGRRPEAAFGEADLRRVAQRTLFIWGDQDAFGRPSTGERACRLMPNARLEVLPGGHGPWIDQPERCAELLSAFLAQ